MEIVKRENHIIDAEGKVLGRLSTQIAVLLRGKHKPTFAPHKDIGDFVIIKNVEKLKFTGKKLVQKDYRYHTLYPGGLKKTSMKKVFENNPTDVIKKAVYGMLPKNRLREEMMKRLTIKA